MKPKIAISACLLGQNVRYDGTDKLQADLVAFLKEHAEIIPVCPETECGLGVPREPMRIEKGEGGDQLVIIKSGVSLTQQMTGWIPGKLDELARVGIRGCILKARSPSCGVKDTPVFYMDGTPIEKGPGFFTRALQEQFPDLIIRTEEELQAEEERKSFLKQVLGN